MKTGKLRIGLIGCGGISNAHARGYVELADKIQVVACCDEIISQAESRAKGLKAEAWYHDYRTLLDRNDIEAVDICTPHDLHAPIAIAAIEAKKHVLVEKPIATTLEDADKIVRAAKKANLKLMVAHNQRYDPLNQKIKELIDTGVIGEVFLGRVDHNQWVGPPGRQAGHWLFSNKKSGGGVVIGSGIHRLDLLRWFMGEVKEVANFQITKQIPMEGEDTAVTILKFKSGSIAEMTSIWAAKLKGAPWHEFVYLYGTKGSIHNVGGLHIYSEAVSDYSSGFTKVAVEEKNSFVEEIRHFADCISNDKEPLTSGPEARKTLEVAIAAYKAAEKNEVIKIKE